MTIDEMIAVLVAAKAGKALQRQRCEMFAWNDWSNGSQQSFGWDFGTYNYRVKPEPREWSVAVFPQGIVSFGAGHPSGWNTVTESLIKVREVLP